MIGRIVMKENLSFKALELELDKGLVVFTGLSGAGKSVLFKGILSCFALAESEAKLVEIELDDKLNLDEFGIEEDETNTFKMLKDKSAKYFINNQSITKKSLNSLSKGFVKYLSAKEEGEFSNEKFLNLLDHLQNKKEPNFLEFVNEFKALFEEFDEVKTALMKVQDEEKKVEELKELAALQIAKIEEVKPKIGEYEELMSLKKRLSKKDKIEAAWQRANAIFELESAVLEALRLSELDSTFFTECLNELRISSQSQNFDELEFDIEALLDRIEKLSSLIQKYGSEAGALEHLAKKQKELEHYENLSFEKKELENKVAILQERLEKNAALLHEKRTANLKELETLLNSYLAKLYMKNVSVKLQQNEKISSQGFDECILQMDTTKLKNFSSGELNRLRLAFIATSSAILNAGRGIIFLDEIDANLSGKEAMSIALVLEELCEFYQIFAISHLPQLSSKAHNHFLVSKKSGVSFVKKLEKDERIDELARMVSGEKISKEALEFAKTLLSH